MSGERYRLDDLLIDTVRQRVEREGQVLDVAGLSFRLLHYLLRQQQRVVGFDELIAQVWAPALVNEDTVTQRVRLLRQALGEDGRNPRYLRSVRGQGYQLCAPAVALPAPPPASPRRWRRAGWIAAALAIAVLLATVALLFWPVSPPPVSPLLQRAAYYAGIGQHDNNERAIALYQQRLQEAPDDSAALLGLSRAYSARVCLFNGDPDNAVQAEMLARRVVSQATDAAAAQAALAYSLDCRGQVDAALRGYEQALRHDPQADAVRASAAYLYERKGRLAEALAANLAVREPARVRFLELQIASNLDLLGYAEAAQTRYRRSFQLYPDNVYSNLAWPRFLFGHGRYGEAQAALEQALQRGSAHAGLYLLQAELALQRGDRSAAAAACRQALALRPQASYVQTLAWLSGAEPMPARAVLVQHAHALRQGMAAGADAGDGIEAALLLDAAGEIPAALQALQQAVAHGYRDAAYLQASPLLSQLRAAPGFSALPASIELQVAAEREQIRRHGRLPPLTAAAGP